MSIHTYYEQLDRMRLDWTTRQSATHTNVATQLTNIECTVYMYTFSKQDVTDGFIPWSACKSKMIAQWISVGLVAFMETPVTFCYIVQWIMCMYGGGEIGNCWCTMFMLTSSMAYMCWLSDHLTAGKMFSLAWAVNYNCLTKFFYLFWLLNERISFNSIVCLLNVHNHFCFNGVEVHHG